LGVPHSQIEWEIVEKRGQMEIGKWLEERYPELKGVVEWWKGLKGEERILALLRIGVAVAVGITVILIILSSIFPGWHGWGGEVEGNPFPNQEQLHRAIFEKGER